RPVLAHRPDRRRRAGGDGRGRPPERGDDPQGRGRPPRGAPRGGLGAPARRPRAARPAARAVQRRGRRDDDHRRGARRAGGGGGGVTASTGTGPLMPTYPPPPVTFVRGEGTHLYDDRGRRYLDLLSGLAVTSLGHAHPAVAEALAAQARTLLHVSNLFGNEMAPEVARTLDRLVGDG